MTIAAWSARGTPLASPRSVTETAFRKLARETSTAVGTSKSFIVAVAVVLLWLAVGPLFHFSDSWQLVINTGTTIVTFLMVFLIQNTQNRHSQAVQLKLDELLRATRRARNQLVNVEELSDEELRSLQDEFRELGELATHEMQERSARRVGHDDHGISH